MSDDLLEQRFEAFIAALRKHFEAAIQYQDPDHDQVIAASDQVEEAFADYDDQLYEELDIELPLDTFDLEDFESEEAVAEVDRFIELASEQDYDQAEYDDSPSDSVIADDQSAGRKKTDYRRLAYDLYRPEDDEDDSQIEDYDFTELQDEDQDS